MYRLCKLSKPPFFSRHFIRYQTKQRAALFHTTRLVNRHEDAPVSNYMESMYQAWLQEPNSVDPSWQIYFQNLSSHGHESHSSSSASIPAFMPSDSARLPEMPGTNIPAGVNASSKKVIDHLKIQLLVRAYQVRGHYLADLDPLAIQHASLENLNPPELTYEYYGFTEADLDRTFSLGPGILSAFHEQELTLREIIDALKKIYCK